MARETTRATKKVAKKVNCCRRRHGRRRRRRAGPQSERRDWTTTEEMRREREAEIQIQIHIRIHGHSRMAVGGSHAEWRLHLARECQPLERAHRLDPRSLAVARHPNDSLPWSRPQSPGERGASRSSNTPSLLDAMGRADFCSRELQSAVIGRQDEDDHCASLELGPPLAQLAIHCRRASF